MSEPELRIDRVGESDAGELLTLRRAAFVTEAQAYGDPSIPPLTQTLSELIADLKNPQVVTLGAWQGHRLIGSLRVLLEGSKATLGRFAVAPDMQGKGIGTQLMLAMLPYLPDDISQVWVFTARDQVHNLTGEGTGYEAQQDETAGRLTRAYLRRLIGDVSEWHRAAF